MYAHPALSPHDCESFTITYLALNVLLILFQIASAADRVSEHKSQFWFQDDNGAIPENPALLPCTLDSAAQEKINLLRSPFQYTGALYVPLLPLLLPHAMVSLVYTPLTYILPSKPPSFMAVAVGATEFFSQRVIVLHAHADVIAFGSDTQVPRLLHDLRPACVVL